MYRSLLVPLDGSPFSEHALPVAQSIMQRMPAGSGATLYLAHVHIPFVSAYVEGVAIVDQEVDAESRKNDQAYSEALSARLTRSNLNTTWALLDGTVADALAQFVTTQPIDLMVMTTHGRGGLSRIWLGSVVDDLIRRSSVPMLVVRPHATEPDFSHTSTFQRILIPLDGSPLAEQILEPTLALGALMEAEYMLLFVVQHHLPTGIRSLRHANEGEHGRIAASQQAAQEYLDSVRRRLERHGRPVHTQVLVAPQPAVAILEHVRHHPADLIALATHGRSGVRRMLLGSVADKVVRGADIPVLLYRPQEHRPDD